MTDQDGVPDTSDRLPASPCPRSPRSLRSAAGAVALTGAILVLIPFGLLLGRDGLVPVSLNRDDPIPTPHLTDCASNQAVLARAVVAGRCVKVVGTGFAPDEIIQVSDSRHPTWQAYVRADAAGHYSLRHVVAAMTAPGSEVLSLVGLQRSNVDASPRAAFCRFTVTPAGR